MSHSSPSKIGEECQIDRISELPEEILSFILSYCTVGEAVFASLLSRRWRHLWRTALPNLDFDWDSMFSGRREYCGNSGGLLCREGSCPLYKDRFVRGVNQLMGNYKGARLVSLRVAFCLGVDYKDDIDHWVSSALSMGIERLDLCLKCDNATSYDWVEHNDKARYIFRFELLCLADKPPKLQYLLLSKFILGPGVTTPFGCLKSLQLTEVLLLARNVIDIFSCFVNLETLSLINCKISDLWIPPSAKRLKFLALVRCIGMNVISVSNSALTTFEYFGYSVQETVRFRFSNVPHLRNICIGSPSQFGWQYLLRQIAKDLPLVESLSISSNVFIGDKVRWDHECITAFNKVKKLVLSVPRAGFDIWMLSVILKACPMLEMLYLGCRMEHYKWPVGFKPACEHLKEVHIGGFHIGRFRIGGLCEDSSFLQLGAYFLNTAVGLERLIIDPQCNIYDGANQWDRSYGRVTWEEGEREKVWSIVKTHRKSSSVVVML